MTNSRKTKWDWATHFPRMADLYRRGQPISKIHKTVQTDTFRPCQRAVYNRFNLERLSIEPGRNSDSPNVESPVGTEGSGVVVCLQSSPRTKSEDAIPKDGEHAAVVEHDLVIAASPSLNEGNTSAISQESGHNGAHSPRILLPASKNVASDLSKASPSQNWTSCMDRDTVEDIAMGTSASAGVLPGADVPEEGQTGRNHKRKKRDKPSNKERDEQVIQNLKDFGLIGAQHSGGRTRHPYRLKEPSRQKTPLGQVWSTKFEKKGGPFEARSNQNSLFGDNDSGYHSGRATPSTLSLTSRPESLTEFLGLHRVACHALHEPKYPEKYCEIQPCHVCGCSRIHVLAWSANYLQLHEFKAELKSMDCKDVQALDTAGNSGLHYAATSGVGFAHLEALIDEGVPVDARNTASQNFLHCLRPCDAGTEICTVDCFKLGLLKLLELVKSTMDFGQQDNDGQTILHVLALYITEPEVRDKTFKFFRRRGCSWAILNRFGKSPKDICPPEYPSSQTMYAVDTFTTVNTSLPDLESSAMSEWQQNDIKNMNSYDILVEAYRNPHYVDSTTKDSILHALSRVSRQSGKVIQKNNIIQDLKKFVTKGVNLNRHNRDGHSPLTAFICNQDFRGSETGATMAKYIDILLWKGGKHGVLNDINVNMMNRKGATAIYEAAIQAQSDTVRSLIEAGANVNARLNNDPKGLSVLQATVVARNRAVQDNDHVLHDRFKNVISHLEHAGAVAYPSSFQERSRLQESYITADLLQ